MNYSLRQLKVFVTVARARSFSRAGEMIGLSQSAVSHSVKELEHQTGVRLLDRTTREVVLTEAGQQLAGRLERLLDELTITLRDAGPGSITMPKSTSPWRILSSTHCWGRSCSTKSILG